jgi:signal transduction histidine kinase
MVGESTGYAMPLRATDALFHIGREALVNAVRHAGAQTIDITITFERKRLSLEVADNGSGFVRDPASERLGLRGMERRAAAIHATFYLETKPGEGTRIRVVAPVPYRGWRFSLGRGAIRSRT